MQKIFILEGCDNTGKSSIGKELSKKWDIPYFKNDIEKNYFNEKDISAYRYLDQLYIQNFLKQTKYSAIIDRAYISDIVYTKIFRYNDNLISKLYRIDKLFSKLNTFIIYFYKKNNKIKDEIIDIKYYEQIHQEYLKFFKNTSCKNIFIDTTDENLERELKEINKGVKNYDRYNTN